jgi:hypothetical protein
LRTGGYREYFKLKESKKEENGENYIMRNFIICSLRQMYDIRG